MPNRLVSILAPPTFKDGESTRVAYVLNAILWFIAAISVLLLPLMLFTTVPVEGFLITGSAVLICSAMLAILHAGRVQLAAHLFLLFLWVVVTGLVAITGGMLSPAAAGFIVVVMAAGLLRGIRGAVILTMINVISVVVIYFLDIHGLLVTLLPLKPFAGGVMACGYLVLANGLFHLALAGRDRALESADVYARELEEGQVLLEQRVAERTASADDARREAEAARQEAEVARREAEAEREKAQALNDLNDAMRGEQEVAQLAANTLRYLCRYLQVQVGALFVMDAMYDGLELAGTFAGAGAGHFSAHFELGEGLVGQAALEKRLIALSDIPAGELMVASALGQHAPRHVLIVPLLYEDRIIGVVELGTLSQFSSAHVDFLHRAAPNVAVALHTAQTRMRVDELLIQTQQQAEELQAQEEELRAVNEELQAQAESLRAWRQQQPAAGGEMNR
ncbi:MAG: GAF domain-containing protein [Anaerolineae bacterium]|nr:GAF domain-containing protein [Anaerolineae bacterium]